MSNHAAEQANPRPEAFVPQQVMSAQVARGAETAVLEGETRGPDYGAVSDGGVRARNSLPNGVIPERGSHQEGVSSAATVQRSSSLSNGGANPSVETGMGAATGHGTTRDPNGTTAATQSPVSTTTQERMQLQQQQQQPVPRQPVPVQPPREGQVASSGNLYAGQPMIPQQLQTAVQQLSQQRASVVQAVQERASRALHGRSQEPGQTMSPSTPRAFSTVVGEQSEVMEPSGRQGLWSVTRISEVLHRRVVAPVMEHVVGPQASSTSSTWQSPTALTTPAQTPLMSPEVRQAMADWTAQSTTLTPRRPPAPAVRDDAGSSASISQEQIMEEVKKQVQIAMAGRDTEVKDLKTQNQELKQALEASAQLLNEVMSAGGSSGQGTLPREAREGHPGVEPGRNPVSEGLGPKVPREVPPDQGGAPRVSEGNPLTWGRPSSSATGAVGGLSDRLFGRGGSPVRMEAGTTQPSIPQFGPPVDLQPCEAEDVDAKAPLDLLVQGMRQLQQVYMDKRGGTEVENLKGVTELAALPELTGETGVEFRDWLYVAEQTIGAMSDSAAQWYEKTLACAKEAYTRYQLASPLERLSVVPKVAAELMEPKWVRLDRKVMSLILNAMPKAVKEDAVTHRCPQWQWCYTDFMYFTAQVASQSAQQS